MSQVIAELLSLSTGRPMPGYIVHFLDLSEATFPEQAEHPLNWNRLHAEGWDDLPRARLGSAFTDESGVARMRCPSSTAGVPDQKVNLWVYASGGRPDKSGFSNVVSVSREVRKAPGPCEVYQLWVAPERLQVLTPRSVISAKFPNGAGQALARQTRSMPTTLDERPQPEEVTAVLKELDRARSEAGTPAVGAFPMPVIWLGDTAGVERDPTTGALVRRDATGARTALQLNGVERRHAAKGRSEIAINVAPDGNLTLTLPDVPDRLEKAHPESDPLLRYFEVTNGESGRRST